MSKNRIGMIVIMTLTLGVSGAYFNRVVAQPDQIFKVSGPGLVKSNHDFHVIYAGKWNFRYDSSNGATEFMQDSLYSPELDKPGATLGVHWFPLAEIKGQTLSSGAAGRYEVVQADKRFGEVIRVDTLTGRTWRSMPGHTEQEPEQTSKLAEKFWYDEAK